MNLSYTTGGSKLLPSLRPLKAVLAYLDSGFVPRRSFAVGVGAGRSWAVLFFHGLKKKHKRNSDAMKLGV
jgi:hypothetical protein